MVIIKRRRHTKGFVRQQGENIHNERTDGVTFQPDVALATLKAIKEFATSEPTIVLPCHDPNSILRLKNKQTFA